ncbi:phage fiber-tail adaptor protein [Nocardia nova]|uniref:phage fiber-tail adaptor protein n=1 Tax=Nocardia nova TaxID=37330 RepID=UPI002738F2CE|nr:hypothetical protein [Nocardia nova]
MSAAVIPVKLKDPGAVLDYRFRWGPNPSNTTVPYLEDTETITSHTITVDQAGLTVENSEVTSDGKDVVIWLSQGTEGITYLVRCEVVTTLSRTDFRSMYVQIRKK